MALELGAAAGGVDPGVTDAPKQQQGRLEGGEQLIEGLAAGDIEHGAKHTKGAGIEGREANRLHQGPIDVGFVDVHLVEGAADRGGAAQVFKQQPLQHRAFEQGRTNRAAGNRPPALGLTGLTAEGSGGIEQGHPGRQGAQGRSGRQGRVAPEGIAHQHGGAADALLHVGHQLVAPKGAAVGQPRRLDAAAKAEQVEGMDLVALGQHRNVEAPVVGGGPKAMDQQQGRTDRLVRAAAQAVDGMALVTPGELLHPLG